jgi:hypothetical protein
MLNTLRHDAVFKKEFFLEDVHLIGCGGVNSLVSQSLAKLGVGVNNQVHFWDKDTVESHNPSNQAYDPSHIKQSKVVALQRQYQVWSGGVEAVIHNQFVTEPIELSGVVFLGVDSMQTRRAICEQSIWRKPSVSLLIEMRMDATNAIVFCVDPNNEDQIECWYAYWHGDDEAENLLGCSGHVSVIDTVQINAALGIGRFRHYANHQYQNMVNRIWFDVQNLQLKTESWQS